MSTVAQIKAAVEELPENDARELAAWIQGFMEDRWDRQIGDDIATGSLDQWADWAMVCATGPAYRAPAVSVPDGFLWFWIGPRAAYERMLRRE